MQKEAEFCDLKITIEFGEKNPLIGNNNIYSNNKIVTTKYNLFTWAPKSLLMQFRRASNIYFLLVSVLTFMSFSPKQPASMIATFAFVLIATMIKELIEDWGRYKQDRQANNRLVWKMIEGGWEQVKCWTLMPGDIIKIEKDEELSADTLVLKSTNDTGYCYIDTKNLDGETNLKEKASLEEFKNLDEYELSNLIGSIECDTSNENLSSWKGKVIWGNTNPIFCKLANIILKGCVLKNTQYICGVVVYSGKNTKIMKNSKSARIKTSKVLLTMNKLLYSLFIFEIALCLTFAALNYMWVWKNETTLTYIFPADRISTTTPLLKFLKYFFTFFVAYSHMIPISLYVALELVKIIQGLLIHYDNEIYDFSINKAASCRATDLIEELGQVEFIFSDKTGTLTQNVMVMKKVWLNGKVYGSVQTEAPDAPFTIGGDTHLVDKLRSENAVETEGKKIIQEFCYLLSLCHAVFPEVNKNNKIIYQGASPDDIALVKGAQQIGFEFVKKEFDDLIIENHITETSKTFEMKIEMPFDSDRKRMSVVVRDKQTNEYILYSKGADTMMLPRMILHASEREEINRVIKVLSKEGLRVLVMAKKVINENSYLDWETRFKEARNNGKEESLNSFYEEMENSLTFLGCSAIEDKLQDGVSDTIYTLLTCNIRVWVLTGDKKDTAEEIAKSCKLINENMFIWELIEDKMDTREKILTMKEEIGIKIESTPGEHKIDLEEVTRLIRKIRGKDMSIIIDGFTLEIIFRDPELSACFFHIAIAAKSVVCCRVSPKQKSKVVQLAKSFGKWITLSIGDGANDVPMIMEAHIGVGIQGKEGTQAVRSADFSIGQFRFLEKLLLIYGRVGYAKISKFICYYFYKNIILVFTDLLFNFQNGFSGQIYFADYFSTMYNAFFTSWPCLFTFSLERDVDLNIVKRFPILYVAGQKNYFFNMKVFWSYIFYAIFHGFICFFISNEGLMNSNDSSGVTFNHWYKSTISFSLVIHIVTYKLLIISDFWNGLNLLTTVFSILFYYAFVLLLCYSPISFLFQNEVAGLIYNLFGYSKFWGVIIVGPLLALIPDITFKQIFYLSWPNPTDYIKQHLRDPVFQSLIFSEESHSAMFNSAEARKAEKILKEILRKSRESRLKRRRNVIESDGLMGLANFQMKSPLELAQYLTLHDNKITSSDQSYSQMINTSSMKKDEPIFDSVSNIRKSSAISVDHERDRIIETGPKSNNRLIIVNKEDIKKMIESNTFSQNLNNSIHTDSATSRDDESFSEKESLSNNNKINVDEFHQNLISVYVAEDPNDSDGESSKKQHIKKLFHDYKKNKSVNKSSENDEESGAIARDLIKHDTNSNKNNGNGKTNTSLSVGKDIISRNNTQHSKGQNHSQSYYEQ